MKLENELRCPHCHSKDIIGEDCTDTYCAGYGDDEVLIETYIGYCHKCGASMDWEVVYQKVGYRNINFEMNE